MKGGENMRHYLFVKFPNGWAELPVSSGTPAVATETRAHEMLRAGQTDEWVVEYTTRGAVMFRAEHGLPEQE